MAQTLVVAVTFRIDADAVDEIEAVDPRVRVVDVSGLFRRELPGEAERNELLRKLGEAEIVFGPNRFPPEYADAARALKWFQVINAGVDRMAKEGLLDRGFVVTTAAGLAASGIAEYVVGVMVMLAKGLHTSVRDQAKHSWESRRTLELSGKTIGIVGLGEIGRETARRARAFGMRVVASRRNVSGVPDADCDELIAHSDLPRLLAQSDYVVVAVPLTPETRHLIGAAELATMRPSAFLVNVARGEVIDQAALISALENGTIAGAGLDVFDPEPLPTDSPLWDMPNVIISPHISGSVEDYGHKATALFVANLRRYVAGEPLSHAVDPVLGY